MKFCGPLRKTEVYEGTITSVHVLNIKLFFEIQSSLILFVLKFGLIDARVSASSERV